MNVNNINIDELELSVRSMNALTRSGITTVGQLRNVPKKVLLTLDNFGARSFKEVREVLALILLAEVRDLKPRDVYLQKVQTPNIPGGEAFVLVDGEGVKIGKQLAVSVEFKVREPTKCTVTFVLDEPFIRQGR